MINSRLSLVVIAVLTFIIIVPNGAANPFIPPENAALGIKITWQGNFTAVWDGKLDISGAQIIQIIPISFEKNQDRFFPSEQRWTSAVKKFPWQYRMNSKQQHYPATQEMWDAHGNAGRLASADGFYLWLTDISESAEIHAAFPKGSLKFTLANLYKDYTISKSFSEQGTVTAALLLPYFQAAEGKQLPQSEHIAKRGQKCEAPVMTVDTKGNKWVSWVQFTDAEHEDIYVTKVKGSKAGTSERISSESTLDFEPRITCDSKGRVWACWTAQNGRNYSIRGKYKTERGWSKEQIISVSEGKNFHPAIAADRSGGVWVVWEAFRDGSYVILGRHFNETSWGREITISDPFVSSHVPSCVTDNDNRCWTAWEGANDGNYEIFLRPVQSGSKGKIVQITKTIENEMRPALAVDSNDNIWIAYQEVSLLKSQFKSKPQKKLEGAARIMAVCFNPSTHEIRAPNSAVSSGTQGQITSHGQKKFPSLLIDQKERLWVFFREVTGGLWSVTALCCGGENWSTPVHVTGDWGGVKYPISPAMDANNQVWVAWDNYTKHPGKPFEDLKGPSRVLLAQVNLPSLPSGSPVLKRIDTNVYPEENHTTSLFPHRKINLNGETYTLYFGNLHKHSDVSQCGRPVNGWMNDHYRFARDIRGINFLMIADHSEHTDHYEWHRTNRAAMLYNEINDFIGFPGYEWTSESHEPGNCYGHYNPVFSPPDGEFVPLKYLVYSARPPYRPDKMWELFGEFKDSNHDVITIPHHPGRLTTAIDFRYYSREFVPVIEIAQTRGSYEYYKPHNYAEPAVKQDPVIQGHFVQDGLAWGNEYGFVASGDHSGNQLAAVFAKSLSRKDIMDALHARRCYATFGEKIFVDFRVNGIFMGGEATLSSPEMPRTLDIQVTGTDVIESIDIIKNNVDIAHYPVGTKEVKFSYTDNEPVYDELTYYYIRVNQDSIEKAWASPVWIKVAE